MSFSNDVKDELSRVEPECKTCAKAMLAALVKSQGILKLTGSGKYTVEFVTDNAWIARFALANFRELYNLDAVLTYRRSVLHKTQNYLIELLQSQNLIKALIDMGIISDNKNSKSKQSMSLSQGIKKEFMLKDCCSAAYLRGAFLGSGYVAEPSGDFHFEISVHRKSQANDMKKILQKKDIKAGVCERRNSYILYIKNGQGITDFLAFTGAHKSALKIENIRVSKNIANQINRQTNADVANSKRKVDAAYNQLIMIEKVANNYGLENLSSSLRDFIKLRIKYRNESLSELGSLSDPPLSKSAVAGRLRRLEQLAKSIK